MSEEQKFPSEVVDLPSLGKLYDPKSPLASGKIEMKYMTAKEEDILTNQNFIEKGVVIDKLLQALIVDKTIDYNELLIGDKNALLVAARILGYGADYEFTYNNVKETVDLSGIDNKPLHEAVAEAKSNEFNFTLPASGAIVTFKLMTHGDEQKVEQELKGLRKIQKDASPEASTRLKYQITSINGDTDKANIRTFVDTQFLARDARAFRKHIADITPDVDLKFYPENGPDGGVDLPIGITFLYPDARV